MKLYPAIDIQSGQCVRLYQGCYDQVTTYHQDPVTVALDFEAQGAAMLHVIDLEGAKYGKSFNLDSVMSIVDVSSLQIQVGGGIRTRQQIVNFLNAGADKVILGSVAISQPQRVKKWLSEFGGEQLVLALDVRFDAKAQPMLATNGWTQASHLSLWQLLDEYRHSPLRHVLCTDISRDGTLQGPNLSLYQACIERYPDIQFQASGGVNTIFDLQQLAQMAMAGTVIGRAFYENNFTFQAALQGVNAC